jgi:serine/threonine protein kinase
MSLASGTPVGPYEIRALIGAGGMGEVYRARDTKLQRVALKVLPEAFVSDPERLARFEREARTLAALNHPHIAHIYGFEQANGVSALVMELVEGEDVAQPFPAGRSRSTKRFRSRGRSPRRSKPRTSRASSIAPANVKVRDDGTVKVLDFGLAKALDSSTSPVSGGRRTEG